MKIRFTKAIKTRILQLIFLITSIYGLFFLSLEWTICALLSYIFLEIVAGNIALHRYFGHKSFETYNFMKPFFRFICHYIGVGSVLSWVGQHRYHHQYSDTPQDVHSPHYQGLFKIMFGIWTLKVEKKMIVDILKDKKLMFWHHNYFKFHVCIIGVYLIVDYFFKMHFFYSLYALPNLMCLFSGYVLAIVTHIHGYQTYSVKDESRNSWIANIYTLGEGWHNNHHAKPDSYKQGELWYEWDIPAFFIKYFFKKPIPEK